MAAIATHNGHKRFTEAGPYDTIITMIRSAGIAVVALVTLCASSASASPDMAERLARQGVLQAKAGDYKAAVGLFKRALKWAPRPDIQCNLGGAYYKLKRWPQAHLYLGICLSHPAELNDAEFVKIMSGVYAKTEQELRRGNFGPVNITVTPKKALARVSAFADDVEFYTPRIVWLPTGSHRVSARAANAFPDGKNFKVLKGQLSNVRLALKPRPVAKRVKVPIGEANTRPSKAGAIVSLGLGAAALIGGGVYYVLARDVADEAEPLERGSDRYEQLRDTFDFRRIMAYSLLGVGAVATVIGTYLYIRAGSESARQVGAAPTRNGGMVWARWRF